MATVEQVALLRKMVAEPDDTTYTDEMLGILIDSFGTDAALPLSSAASAIWFQKAASYAELVNISEGGSSRANGELYKRATEMGNLYQSQVDVATGSSQRTRVARLVR